MRMQDGVEFGIKIRPPVHLLEGGIWDILYNLEEIQPIPDITLQSHNLDHVAVLQFNLANLSIIIKSLPI